MSKQVDPVTLARALALMETFKAGDAASAPTATYVHGPGGVASQPMNPDIINAMVMPHLGLDAILPVRGTTELNPLFGVFTGVTDGSGNYPSAVCDPWPKGGNLKMIEVTFPFGRRGFSTNTIDLTDPKIGGLLNRGEFRDFRLMGDPLNGSDAKVVPGQTPGGSGADVTQALNRHLAAEMLTFKIGYFRKYGRTTYTGNPLNNVYSGSSLVYGEPIGLEILVNKGWQDAITKTYSPAADSTVVNINLNVAGNGDAYVRAFTYDYRRAQKMAEGLAPVRFVYVMPTMFFTELADVWPCAYKTNRCVVNANGATVNLTASDMRELSDQMRNGRYLLIDGKQVEVVLDDAITETEGAGGEFTSSVYRLPLTILGSDPVLFKEYFDFSNPYNDEVRRAFSAGDEFMVTDGGRFFWTKRKTGHCVSLDALEMPRLILLAPMLATRFTNVKYTPLMVNRSGWPTDTSRFYDGGLTSRTAPSFYSPNVYAGY